MSRNYLNSEEFRRYDREYAERMDRRPKRLHGIDAQIRTIEEAQAAIDAERKAWERGQ